MKAELNSLPTGRVPEGRKSVSVGRQIAALLQRSVLDNWRNPSVARAKIIQKSVMGLFIGLLYLQVSLFHIFSLFIKDTIDLNWNFEYQWCSVLPGLRIDILHVIRNPHIPSF